MDFRELDIILVDTHGGLGDIIDWFQGNAYNHAGLIVKGFGKTWVYEALAGGPAFTPIEEYIEQLNKGNIRFTRLRYKDKLEYDKDKLWRIMLEHTSDRYSFENLLLWQAVKYLYKKFIWKPLHKFDKDLPDQLWIGKKQKNAHICGELVAYVYNELFGMFPHYERMAPADLFNNGDFYKTFYDESWKKKK